VLAVNSATELALAATLEWVAVVGPGMGSSWGVS
jgi:hypothetical protein